jgi:hypothetical protein
MRTTQQVGAAVGLVTLACLITAAGPELATVEPVPLVQDASYALTADSVFAQGCAGSPGTFGYGCMCPIRMADEFTGTFTMTPEWHTPPGMQAFYVTVEDWIVNFGGEDIEITGEGYYARWSELDGSLWQSMTLDVSIYGNPIQLSSGVVENPTPGGAPPAEIQISLDNDPVCYGYWITIDAEHLPPAEPVPPDADEDAADNVEMIEKDAVEMEPLSE